MEGLSAKVFRTYNASITLCSELQKTADQVTTAKIAKESRDPRSHTPHSPYLQVTKAKIAKEGYVEAHCEWYHIANKNVAELCNHQKATSAAHQGQIAKLDEKIDGLRAELKAAKKAGNDTKVASLTKRIEKAELDKRQKDALKNVSLGTSKINYNDPRITVAWCKRHDVPIQKPFAKTLMAKFTWAMSVEPSFRF